MKTFPSELTAYEIALDEWQENVRKWEAISGDRFNVSMKKALFLDKAPSSVRVPLQKQNLVTFEAMTAVTLQFLQHNAHLTTGGKWCNFKNNEITLFLFFEVLFDLFFHCVFHFDFPCCLSWMCSFIFFFFFHVL